MLIGEAAVGHRFLDGVEVGALDVLDEGEFEQFGASRLAEDDGDGAEAGETGGLEPPFAGDEAIPARFVAGDDEGLDDAVLADGLGQLAELFGLEVGARLLGVWGDEVDVEVVSRTPCRRWRLGRIREARWWRRRQRWASAEKGIEPTAEAAPRLRHSAPPAVAAAGAPARESSSSASALYAAAALPAGS